MILCAKPSDFQFLFRLEQLLQLHIGSIDAETIRKFLEDFQFLSLFTFTYASKLFVVQIENGPSKRFLVSVGGKKTQFSDSNDAFQFITGHSNSILWGLFGFVAELASDLVRGILSFLHVNY